MYYGLLASHQTSLLMGIGRWKKCCTFPYTFEILLFLNSSQLIWDWGWFSSRKLRITLQRFTKSRFGRILKNQEADYYRSYMKFIPHQKNIVKYFICRKKIKRRVIFQSFLFYVRMYSRTGVVFLQLSKWIFFMDDYVIILF